MIDQEEKTKKLGKWLTWGLGLVVIGLLAPLLISALKGVLALGAAIAVTWLIVVVATQVLPFITDAWLPNQMMKLYNWEAWRNPIETLRNDLQNERENLKEFNRDTTNLDVECQRFENLVCEAEDVAPDRPATKALRQQATEFKQVLDEQRQEAVRYAVKLQEYEKEIDVAEIIYKASQAGTRLLKKIAGGNKKAYAEIMKKTAISSVKNSLMEMRAQLNTNRNLAKAKLAAIQNGQPEKSDEQKMLEAKTSMPTMLIPTTEKAKVQR